MPLPSKQWLIDRYLFGVDLTDDKKAPFPDAMYQNGVDAGLAWLRTELGLPIKKATFVERQDYDPNMGRAWQMIQLNHRPVVSITKIEWIYGNKVVAALPAEWIVLMDELSGQIQIMPTTGSLPTNYPLMASLFFTYPTNGVVPGWYRITYEAGWADDDVPADIVHCWGMYASMAALNPAGDLIAGAGIANFSTSMDGISQSVGTTSSATNSGYGSRIIQYWKDIDRLLPLIRARYAGGSMMEVA